jgi:uncharacterized membrane protein
MYEQGTTRTGNHRALAVWLQKRTLGLSRHWLAWANLGWGMLFGLPWLAPILMEAGASWPGRAIYTIYSFLCHQFANRSFFLFGPKSMYSYSELQSVAPDAATWLGLRAFIGSAEVGYKVAWSDRMVSLYGGVLLGGLLFALFRRYVKPPRGRTLVLMIAPIILDGTTHWISDLAGVGRGFRYTNAWLGTLTGNALPQSFYVGNALGSFNSWMRLITGLLFGLAMVWLTYPFIADYFQEIRQTLEARYRPLGPAAIE